MPFLLQNSFLAILMLISQKPVQRRVIGKKCVFFAGRQKRVKTEIIMRQGLVVMDH